MTQQANLGKALKREDEGGGLALQPTTWKGIQVWEMQTFEIASRSTVDCQLIVLMSFM